MPKITVNNIGTLEDNSALAKLNENFQIITDEFDEVLSLDGFNPSAMTSDLDMNSNQILNLPDAITSQEPVTLSQLGTSLQAFTELGTLPFSSFDYIQFTGGTGDQGTVSWNTDEETLDIIQNGATLQVGQEVQIHCRNNTGSDIPNGTPVMATGTLGASGRITIAPMDSTDPANAKFFIGIATEDIEDGTDGKVTTFGKIRHIDTTDSSIFTGTIIDGNVLYLDPANAGKLTNVEPTGFDLNMAVAFVIHAASNGTLMVRVNNLDENRFVEATSSTFTADTTNSRVGIGTSTPTSKLTITGLPTSSAGLSTGDVWNDAGTLKIVT